MQVLILTGFPCRTTASPPTETDGPSGAVALAVAALRAGKTAVAIATDDSSHDVLQATVAAAGIADSRFQLLSFPAFTHDGWRVRPATTAAADADAAAAAAPEPGPLTMRLVQLWKEYDHVVAIERAGVCTPGPYTVTGWEHLLCTPQEVQSATSTASSSSNSSGNSSDAAAADAGVASAYGVQWCTMRAIPMAALVAPLDALVYCGATPTTTTAATAAADTAEWVTAATHPAAPLAWRRLHDLLGTDAGAAAAAAPRSTTGIGDGGNEAGMGKRKPAVVGHIRNGPGIAAAVPARNLVTAGVSNHGGWALAAAAEAALRLVPGAAAAAALAAQPAGYCVPTVEEDVALVAAMVSAGAADGITGARDGCVDGLTPAVHAALLQRLRHALAAALHAAAPSSATS